MHLHVGTYTMQQDRVIEMIIPKKYLISRMLFAVNKIDVCSWGPYMQRQWNEQIHMLQIH